MDEDEKDTTKKCTLGGNQEVVIINESGLYNAVFGSKKPEAKDFKKWITGTVLPSIRKTGFYATPITTEKILADPDWFIGVLQQYKQERIARLEAENRNLTLKIQLDVSEDWWTVSRFMAMSKMTYKDNKALAQLGKKLSGMARSLGMEIKKAKDERYGKVNSYHTDLFKILFPKWADQIEQEKLR